MISTLTGVLRSKTPTEIVIDVQGVGYAVSIPLSTFEKLPNLESSVTILTSLQVREDALQLYGFLTEDERFLFRLLVTVSGIGPRIAQSILSGISGQELRSHIAKGNIAALTAIPGIGKKTAERLVLELREKVAKPKGAEAAPQDERYAQALSALLSLGYSRVVAEKALHQVARAGDFSALSLEEIIKQALRHAVSA